MSPSPSYVIDSDLDDIPGARQWSAANAKAAGLDEDAVFAVELAVTETLANVIRHSHRGESGHEIRLSAQRGTGMLRVAIEDDGEPFEPTNYTAPDLDAAHEGGYGIYLVETLMDGVERNHVDGRTITSLTKWKSEDAP